MEKQDSVLRREQLALPFEGGPCCVTGEVIDEVPEPAHKHAAQLNRL